MHPSVGSDAASHSPLQPRAQDTPPRPTKRLGTPRFLFRVFCIVALPKLQAGSQCGFAQDE